MGNLARSAIFRGGIVESKRLLGDRSCAAMEAFLALLQYKPDDVVRVADKILAKEDLNESDLLTLYTRFDISLLLKLVELRLKPGPLTAPEPVTLMGQANSSPAFNYPLPQDRDSSLYLVLGGAELSERDLFEQLSGVSPGEASSLVLVGPSLEELLIASGQSKIIGLEEILDALRAAGVSRFRATSSLEFAAVLKRSGCPVTLCSPLDLLYSPRVFVRHLMEVRDSGILSGAGSVWEPGLLRWNSSLRANLDLNLSLLKALTLGAIIFDGTVPVRASSRYFSIDALRLSHLFGADSLGVAALNLPTVTGLGFLPISAFRDMAVGRLDQCAWESVP